MPMTMSPPTPRPPPTTADASQPATSPTTNQINRVSVLMIFLRAPSLRTNRRLAKSSRRRRARSVVALSNERASLTDRKIVVYLQSHQTIDRPPPNSAAARRERPIVPRMDPTDRTSEGRERARVALLASVAAIDRQIAGLGQSPANESFGDPKELHAAWTKVVELLLSRPEAHACPVCGRGVTHAATLCGFCTKRGPGPAARLWRQTV